ncbi:MAG: M20/M25/M40 family metallo-hydrolase [bacterium]
MKNFIRLFIFCSFLFSFPAFCASPEPLPILELLQQLIRIDTSNPPGNEIVLAKWIQGYLQRFGIPSEIIESSPGRANLIARLTGDGSAEPLALLGHLDVVPADPQEWDHPPFAAEIEGDSLYGRGSLDMKGLVALEVNAFIRLKEEKLPLKRDVILVLTSDEEAGGKQGAQFLTEQHWDKVKAKYVFNEGSIGIRHGNRNLYSIQVAEKGVSWMKLTAHGSSGHGSMPRPDNAVVSLVNAMHRLANSPQPLVKTEVVQEFLNRTSKDAPFLTGWMMRHLFDWPLVKFAPLLIRDELKRQKAFNAMVRNTVTPTMLNAGYKINVIPAEATGFVDARILPGETPAAFQKKLEKVLGDLPVKLEPILQSEPNASDFRTPYFETIEKAILENDPEAIVTPYMSPGATDSRFFREKGVVCYGLIPFVISENDIDSSHGKNERVKVTELTRRRKKSV